MRKTLFVATILIAGAMPPMPSHAAPGFNFDTSTVISRSGALTVREASEAPRGKDGPHDRNRSGSHPSNATSYRSDPSGVMLVREAGERPRGEGGTHP